MRVLRRSISAVLSLALAALTLWVTVPAASALVAGSAIRITEFAYGGKVAGAATGDGEYAELTNTGDVAQDLTGWTYNTGTAPTATGGLSLTGLGTVAPGESVIVTDLTAAQFRTEWGLVSTVKVLSTGGTPSLNSGPSSLHVYDAGGVEVDGLTYAKGFQSAKGQAAWVDGAHVGAEKDTTGWTIATAGDAQGSWTSAAGSIGSPGASTLGTRTPADVRVATTPPPTGPTDPNYASIVINEITSNNSGNGYAPLDADDLVELHNTGAQVVSLAGWKQTDSNAAGFSSATDFSTGLYVNGVLATSIPAGGYGVFSSGPGLSSAGDAVKVFTPDGTLVDQVTYLAGQAGKDETVNTAGTYTALASCPNGGDAVLEVPTTSFGASNATACQSGVPPLTSGNGPEAPCQTEDSGTAPGTVPAGVVAWPGSATPTTIDPQCAWVTSLSGQDLSGLAFDPNNADLLYAVKNKSHVYRLVRSGGTWTKDAANGWSDGKDLRFPVGTGQPDSEGLAVGPDGALYVTTERDNAASGVPLDTILKFDPTSSATTLVATDQWTLTSDLGFTAADANLGFEGVAYVPDTFLTASRFRTDDGALYDPAAYPGKAVPGLFLGAVEKTGHLRAYVLNTDHTWARVADIDTGMVGVMDASYDPDLGRVWAHCDNTCGNATALLEIGSDGHFSVDRDYATPTGLPDYNLEGFAVAPTSTATGGTREVLWTDDGNRFGHSLWSGTIDLALGLTQTATPTPTIGGSPAYGQTLTAGVGSWDPGVTTHYVWKDGSTVLATDAPLTLSDPALVGRTVTLAVTGTRTGFTSVTTSATTTVAAAALSAPAPTIGGTPAVGRTLTATAAWGPGPVQLTYTWLADGRLVPGANASTLRLGAAQAGTTITVVVSGTRPGYAGATATSAPSGPVQLGTVSTARPKVKGPAEVGRTLIVRPGAWSADGARVTLDYRWFANGKAIRGATGAKLRLTRALRGDRITVEVTGSAPGYAPAYARSKAARVR